jgi:hypothetical protein
VLPSELIQIVVNREFSRLFSWSSDHVPVPEARRATVRAFADVLPRAMTSWRTAHGPFAFLLTSTESWMRARNVAVQRYLGPTIHLTCTLPNVQELQELADVYAWIGMGAEQLDLPYTMQTCVLAAINVHAIGDPVERCVKGRQYEPMKGRETLGRLLDVVDHMVKLGEEPATDATAVARREFERSRRWLMRVPGQRGW